MILAREIKTFIVVAREGSIRRAAEKLHIVPTALSRHIKKLEEYLGVELMVRHRKGVILTQRGQEIYERALSWQAEIDYTRLKLAKTNIADEVLRVGLMECLSGNTLMCLFNKLSEALPEFHFEAVVGDTNYLTRQLEKSRLDVIVAFNIEKSRNVEVLREYTGRVGLIYSQGFVFPEGLNLRQEIALNDCLRWPLCLPTNQLTLYTKLHSEIAHSSCPVNIIASSNSIHFLKNLVKKKNFVSFLNWFDVHEDVRANHIGFKPLKGQKFLEKLGVCVSPDQQTKASISQLVKYLDSLLDIQPESL